MRVKERTVIDSKCCEQVKIECGLPIFKVIDDDDACDPFLLFEHIGPVAFRPGEAVGAPDHPHRGIELISVLVQGSIHHADSIGHDSVLPAGTVQHIKFGRGFVHFEMPTDEMQQSGGVLEGYQIWVNQPRQQKLSDPVYNEFAPNDVPCVRNEDSTAEVRVISGCYMGVDGIINCNTPVLLLDVRINCGANLSIDIPYQLEQAFIYSFNGSAQIGSDNNYSLASNQRVALTQGESVQLSTTNSGPCHLLIGAGVPLREPVVKSGPFAMSTQQEITDAVQDYMQGSMGACPPPGVEARKLQIESAIAVQRANCHQH